MLELFESNDKNTIPEIRGTAYNMLNAVTEYADHYRTARITEGKQELTIEQVRAQSSVFGSGQKLKTEALTAILEETVDAPTRESVSVHNAKSFGFDSDQDFLNTLGIRS